MEGNNELRLCHAEMIAALQMYVEHLMPTAEAKVVSVESEREGFVIVLTKED